MRLGKKSEYTIIAFSQTGTSVCCFRKMRQKYVVTGFAGVDVSRDADSATALKNAVKQAGGWKGCIILTGNMPSGEFFRCQALDVPGAAARKAALSFELPNHMLHVPDDPVIQFSESGTETPVWNVYAFPSQSFQSLAALLSPSHKKADELIHPLLTIRQNDDDIYFPKLETDYVFSNGQWREKESGEEMLSDFWKQEFEKYFILPEGFEAEKYTECLAVMRFIITAMSADMEKSIRILPARLRMKRLRYHVGIMIGLILLLIGVNSIDTIREQMTQYNDFQELMREKKQLSAKIMETKRLLKKKEKQEKDRKRIMQYDPGCKDVLNRLYKLSKIVPDDAVISGVRISSHAIYVNIPTVSDNANFQKSIKDIPDWDIKTINTRQTNFEGKQVSRTDISIIVKESDHE